MRKAANDTRAEGDLFALVQEWRDLWGMLNDGRDAPPHVIGAKLRALNGVARRIAASSRGGHLTAEELALMTEVELVILRDQLSSPLMRRAI